MAKISIIVPIYNVEQYLRECLESLIKQTFQDIEIIAVNDGSLDGSGQICDQYALMDERVKVFHQANAGVSEARNYGLEHASGEWILFVDGDDWVEPSLCQTLLQAAMQSKADLVLCGHFWNYPNQEYPVRMFSEDRYIDPLNIRRIILDSTLVESSCVSNATYVWGKLWRSSLLRGNVRFKSNLKWGEDQLFNLNGLTNVTRAFHLKQSLYHYRINATSITNSYKKNRIEMLNDYLYELKAYVDASIDTDSYLKELYDRRVLYTLILFVNIHICNSKYREPLLTKRLQLCKILKLEPYRSAIQNVDVSCLNIQRKIFASLARYRLSFIIILVSYVKKLLRI